MARLTAKQVGRLLDQASASRPPPEDAANNAGNTTDLGNLGRPITPIRQPLNKVLSRSPSGPVVPSGWRATPQPGAAGRCRSIPRFVANAAFGVPGGLQVEQCDHRRADADAPVTRHGTTRDLR